MIARIAMLFAGFIFLHLGPAAAQQVNVCLPSAADTFEVINVNSDDTLNVRSGPTSQYGILDKLWHRQRNIISTGNVAYQTEGCEAACTAYSNGNLATISYIEEQCLSKSQIWFELVSPSGASGWASAKYLQIQLAPIMNQPAVDFAQGQVSEPVSSSAEASVKDVDAILEDQFEQQLLDARLLINDVEEYLQNGIGEKFGYEIVSLYQNVISIKAGQWEIVNRTSYADFERFVLQNTMFADFHDRQGEIRNQLLIEELRVATGQLHLEGDLLKEWIDKNLLNSRAAEVLAAIAIADTALTRRSLVDINNSLDALGELSASLGIVKIPDSTRANNELAEIILSDWTIYSNVSGTAPNMYRDITGEFAFENARASICLSDTVAISSSDIYYLKQLLEQNYSLPQTKEYLDCNVDGLNRYDLLVFSGRVFNSTNSRFDSLDTLQETGQYAELGTIRQSDIILLRKNDETEVARIEASLRIGEDNGFVGVIRDGTNSDKVCLVVQDFEIAHELSFVSYTGYLEAVHNFIPIEFSIETLADAFKLFQRDECGSVYSKSSDMTKIIGAAQRLELTIEVLPISQMEESVSQLQAEIDAAEQVVINAQVEQMTNLEQQRLLDDLTSQDLLAGNKARQIALREQHGARFESLFAPMRAVMSEVFDLGVGTRRSNPVYNQKYQELSNFVSYANSMPFDPLLEELNGEIIQGWEETERSITKRDYGSAQYDGRSVEGVIILVEQKLKNSLVGDYADRCLNVAFIFDQEFGAYRATSLFSCADQFSFELWKTTANFDSRWNTETD